MDPPPPPLGSACASLVLAQPKGTELLLGWRTVSVGVRRSLELKNTDCYICIPWLRTLFKFFFSFWIGFRPGDDAAAARVSSRFHRYLSLVSSSSSSSSLLFQLPSRSKSLLADTKTFLVCPISDRMNCFGSPFNLFPFGLLLVVYYNVERRRRLLVVAVVSAHHGCEEIINCWMNLYLLRTQELFLATLLRRRVYKTSQRGPEEISSRASNFWQQCLYRWRPRNLMCWLLYSLGCILGMCVCVRAKSFACHHHQIKKKTIPFFL